ncbi:MAG: hypothetical protein B7Z31_08550 [Rhodobacterales bacterium 12-65-15]|nr:MAG: hypothetical protein B7Z31_08550 [Rhodobacterales bacterium 12-65-15]
MTKDVAAHNSDFSPSSEGFDAATYESVARSARLREVRLVNSAYSAKVMSFMAVELGDGTELKQSYTGTPSRHSFMSERGIAAGSYLWTAEVRAGRTKAMKLSTEYMVAYSGLKDAPEEYVELYFKKLARFTTYPYFRSHFAVHVASSGLMLAPLPSLTDRVD